MNKTEILKLYKKYHVPVHVIAHMVQVKNVCEILADKFIEKGYEIDKKTLLNAALVHDLFRVCDFRNLDPSQFKQKITKEDLKMWHHLREKYGKVGHVKAVGDFLRNKGELKFADLVEKHDFYRIDDLITLEEKILFYADKRVDHDVIVSLKKRFSEGTKRNKKEGDNESLRIETQNKIIKLERELASKLGVSPRFLL